MDPLAFDFYWEDFPVGQVRAMGRHRFTEDEIVAFARQYDRQRFHLDPESARDTVFGGLIASGWHTCAVAMRGMCDAYLSRSACLGSPGLDNLQWLKPVRPGDEIAFRARVLESRPSTSKPDLGLTKFLWDAVNGAGEQVLAMEGWQLFARRKPGADASAR
ncbi:MAG: MaoC family dehydratase [Betaproteobacteria bacterium]|nr:MAG: MaoC family dehydratase [Betaproteobacteria bacterium]